MRTIGISNRTRHWQHYVFSHPPDDYRYLRGLDIPWHLLPVRNHFLLHTKWFASPWKYDLFHTYNSIVANHRPWVVEVESHFPRYGVMAPSHPLYKWGQRRLAHSDCKWIIFTSENTFRMNRDKLAGMGVDPGKMMVVYRAVEQFDPLPKDDSRFTILFAGNAFYRKGGVELIKAFQWLGRSDARLVVISSLEVDWSVRPDADTIAWVERTIQDDARIELHRGLPHDQVLKLMRQAHVYVSTTFADPFNNTVLEAMGAQLPVISSRVSSIPEMVEDGRNGWLVEVSGVDSDQIADAVRDKLRILIDDERKLREMGSQSRNIVRDKFDIAVRNRQIKQLYDRALER